MLPGKAVPEMAYTALGKTLNPTHSLTHVTFTAVFLGRTSLHFLAWLNLHSNCFSCVSFKFFKWPGESFTSHSTHYWSFPSRVSMDFL